MTIRFTIILIILIDVCNSFAQTRHDVKIVYAADKIGYLYFPKEALSDSVDAVLCPYKPLKYVAPNSRPISFQWNSNCNDGDYYLTITPKQVYFSSGHNNPNPNFLYWFINIDSAQYLHIKAGLLKRTPKGFQSPPKYSKGTELSYYDQQFVDTFKIPEEWTDSVQEKFATYCDLQIKQQLKKYFEMINSFIADPLKKIIPLTEEEIIKIHPKYLSARKQEILEWMPRRIIE